MSSAEVTEEGSPNVTEEGITVRQRLIGFTAVLVVVFLIVIALGFLL